MRNYNFLFWGIVLSSEMDLADSMLILQVFMKALTALSSQMELAEKIDKSVENNLRWWELQTYVLYNVLKGHL